MTKETSTQIDAKPTGANLEALTQRQAAWLVNKPAVWFRDNPHCCGMNADGQSYNARELVQAIATDYQPAELAEADVEYAMSLAESLGFSDSIEGTLPAAIRILESVENNSGAAGMAAFGYLLLEYFHEKRELFSQRTSKKPTAEGIQAEADRRIAALPSWDASRERREVRLCPRCHRYRWGHEWLKKPIPAGHIAEHTICPDCNKSRNEETTEDQEQ